MVKEIISVERLHEIVNSSGIRRIRMVDHTVISGQTFDVWIVDYPDCEEGVIYYTPQK